MNRKTKYGSPWLCIPLALLATTGVLASNQVAHPESSAEKFPDETANIVKDYTSFLNNQELPSSKQISSYTVEE